jgi:hypothetical protein
MFMRTSPFVLQGYVEVLVLRNQAGWKPDVFRDRTRLARHVLARCLL